MNPDLDIHSPISWNCAAICGDRPVSYTPHHSYNSLADIPSSILYDIVIISAPSLQEFLSSCAALQPFLHPDAIVVVESTGYVRLESVVHLSLPKHPHIPVLSIMNESDVRCVAQNAYWHQASGSDYRIYFGTSLPADADLAKQVNFSRLYHLLQTVQLDSNGSITLLKSLTSREFVTYQWKLALPRIVFQPLSIIFESETPQQLADQILCKPLISGLIAELFKVIKKMECKLVKGFENEANLLKNQIANFSVPATKAKNGAPYSNPLFYNYDKQQNLELDLLLLQPILLADDKGVRTPYLENLYSLMCQYSKINQSPSKSIFFERRSGLSAVPQPDPHAAAEKQAHLQDLDLEIAQKSLRLQQVSDQIAELELKLALLNSHLANQENQLVQVTSELAKAEQTLALYRTEFDEFKREFLEAKKANEAQRASTALMESRVASNGEYAHSDPSTGVANEYTQNPTSATNGYPQNPSTGANEYTQNPPSATTGYPQNPSTGAIEYTQNPTSVANGYTQNPNPVANGYAQNPPSEQQTSLVTSPLAHKFTARQTDDDDQEEEQAILDASFGHLVILDTPEQATRFEHDGAEFQQPQPSQPPQQLHQQGAPGPNYPQPQTRAAPGPGAPYTQPYTGAPAPIHYSQQQGYPAQQYQNNQPPVPPHQYQGQQPYNGYQQPSGLHYHVPQVPNAPGTGNPDPSYAYHGLPPQQHQQQYPQGAPGHYAYPQGYANGAQSTHTMSLGTNARYQGQPPYQPALAPHGGINGYPGHPQRAHRGGSSGSIAISEMANAGQYNSQQMYAAPIDLLLEQRFKTNPKKQNRRSALPQLRNVSDGADFGGRGGMPVVVKHRSAMNISGMGGPRLSTLGGIPGEPNFGQPAAVPPPPPANQPIASQMSTPPATTLTQSSGQAVETGGRPNGTDKQYAQNSNTEQVAAKPLGGVASAGGAKAETGKKKRGFFGKK